MRKRGGVRVIYIVQTSEGCLVLLLIYAKNAADNIPAHVLRKVAEEWGDGTL